MPGFVIHFAVAKEYLKRHKDDQEDEYKFYRGVIAPDLLKKPETAGLTVDTYVKIYHGLAALSGYGIFLQINVMRVIENKER